MIGAKVARACALALLSTLLIPATLWAQDDASTSSTLTSSSTTTTTTAVCVGGIVITIVMLTPGADNAQLHEYMRNNRVALTQDLTLGAGESLDDLAQAFRVVPSEKIAFARMMREHRAELMEVLRRPQLTSDDAEEFVRRIYAAMSSTSELSRSTVALLRTQPS